MQTTINERIRTIIDVLYRGNVTGFANSIGYGASTIHSIVGKKQSVPTFSVLDKIYTDSRKHGVSAHWLLTGEGEMTKKTENTNSNCLDLVMEKDKIIMEKDKMIMGLLKLL